MLAWEVALGTSSLKIPYEKATSSPDDSGFRKQIKKLKEDISEKKLQIQVLEQRVIGSFEMAPHTLDSNELSQLNENTFELEIKSADNRIHQEQLQMKMFQNAILILRQQLNSLPDKSSSSLGQTAEENDVAPLEELQYIHVEAMTKICHAKDMPALHSQTPMT